MGSKDLKGPRDLVVNRVLQEHGVSQGKLDQWVLWGQLEELEKQALVVSLVQVSQVPQALLGPLDNQDHLDQQVSQ